MKLRSTLVLLAFSSQLSAANTLLGGIAVDVYPNDRPKAGYPVAEPPLIQNPGYPLPKRVPNRTLAGARFLSDYADRFCRDPDSHIVCKNHILNSDGSNYDWGFRIYRKDTGAYLGTMDRNVGEEVAADAATALINAENQHPESKWVARQEAEKAKIEYILAACQAGAVYCTGMATKTEKYTQMFMAACSAWSGVCVTNLQRAKEEVQKKIDAVKAACAKNDQACFDAVTNGGETRAREMSTIERTQGIPNSPGDRPPHNVGRPTTFATGDTDLWYDPSCQHCKIYEGTPAENY